MRRGSNMGSTEFGPPYRNLNRCGLRLHRRNIMGFPKLRACCFGFILATLLPAQTMPGQGIPPGQYPSGQYPPGQYPRGQYPPSQNPGPSGGIPRPWGKKSKKQAATVNPDFFADAQIVSIGEKQLVAATDDGRTLTLSVVPQTVWQRDGKTAAISDLKPGMVIHIEAAEDPESYLTALTVNVTADKKLKVRPPVEDAPVVQPDEPETNAAGNSDPLGSPPDDPDRPVLRRGKPVQTASRASDQDKPVAPTRPTASAKAAKAPASLNEITEFTIEEHSDPKKLSSGTPTLVAQTMEWVNTFANGLPNFICQQITTRYAKESRSEDWQPLDVVTAKVIYEDGGEKYQDITLGGKKTSKSMLQLGGSTSTGEFAAILRGLFWPGTKANFHFAKPATIGATPVSVYDFEVDLAHSDWTIKVGGQSLKPAYSGQVWINKSTGEVRKIEMQADNVPANFPLKSVYSSVAYDPVKLGTSTFLLPVLAVNQSCDRKSSTCNKNDVEWRNYQKFSGASTITFQ